MMSIGTQKAFCMPIDTRMLFDWLVIGQMMPTNPGLPFVDRSMS